ncbi:MAG: endonuclease/exonuclease/phosphatase family protein [Desulfobulbaceae bacterium]|nr:endonuclease/exonuclease/phosphatase family protein [Desulfobulbaceae bacterium]
MRISGLHYLSRLMNIFALFLLSALLYQVVIGCATIPSEEQLVSCKNGTPLIRIEGSCSEKSFTAEKQSMRLEQQRLDPNHIAILDWNIYKGQRPGWQNDFLRLSTAKDIIFLQEAPLNERMQEMLQQHNLCWNLNSAFSYRGLETGVLVASTVQPLGSCGLRHREPIIGVPKTILISRYMIAGSTDKLLVANIHGINISLGTGAYQKQLDGLQNILEKHEGPIILAGDFNNWSKKRTAIMTSMVENLSLQALAFDGKARTTFFGDPVDHILYRGLKPVTYEVHPVTSSDHNPISVTFRLARTQPAADLVAW